MLMAQKELTISPCFAQECTVIHLLGMLHLNKVVLQVCAPPDKYNQFFTNIFLKLNYIF